MLWKVLPVESGGRRIAKELREAGYDVDYREFDGGHIVPPDLVAAATKRFLG
jgi:phospholipase/carboxylesterase